MPRAGRQSNAYDPINDYAGFDTRLEWPSGELAGLIAADILPCGRALDLGCGHGTEALLLADHGWEVTGIDTDKEALAAARLRSRHLGPRARNVRFVHASALAYRPPRGNRFDLVLERLLYVNFFPQTDFPKPRIGYARARRSLLATIARCVRPGGITVMRFKIDGRFPVAGRVTPSLRTRTRPDQEYLRRYFDGSQREVAFVGVAGDAGPLTATLTPKPVELGVVVLRRNSVPVP